MRQNRQHRHTNRHDRRERYDPTPEERVERDPSLLEDAREVIADLDLPTTPDVSTVRILRVESFPTWCGDRKVHDVRITEGEPMHGEKRSDDHIGRFDIEAPAGEFDVPRDVVEGTEFNGDRIHACPDCGYDRLRYRYNANHFISGSEALYCPLCEATIHSEEWG